MGCSKMSVQKRHSTVGFPIRPTGPLLSHAGIIMDRRTRPTIKIKIIAAIIDVLDFTLVPTPPLSNRCSTMDASLIEMTQEQIASNPRGHNNNPKESRDKNIYRKAGKMRTIESSLILRVFIKKTNF
jgi:hypothetical protein